VLVAVVVAMLAEGTGPTMRDEIRKRCIETCTRGGARLRRGTAMNVTWRTNGRTDVDG